MAMLMDYWVFLEIHKLLHINHIIMYDKYRQKSRFQRKQKVVTHLDIYFNS